MHNMCNTVRESGVEELNTAQGIAECCKQLRDPNPCTVLLVQYRNNHGITNLLYFLWAKVSSMWQQQQKISVYVYKA